MPGAGSYFGSGAGNSTYLAGSYCPEPREKGTLKYSQIEGYMRKRRGSMMRFFINLYRFHWTYGDLNSGAVEDYRKIVNAFKTATPHRTLSPSAANTPLNRAFNLFIEVMKR